MRNVVIFVPTLGMPAILLPRPTVKGFKIAAANPTPVPRMTMEEPTILSYPSVIAMATKAGISPHASSFIPNVVPPRAKSVKNMGIRK